MSAPQEESWSSAMSDTSASKRTPERLFDIELVYQHDLPALSTDEGRPGEYLGSGAGRASGPRLNGTIRWDLRENTGKTACDMFFTGVIETDDGASITFETLGHGLVSEPETAPSLWDVTASVRFTSADDRYAWLTVRPATWHGTFDMSTYKHRYRVYRADF